jgi:hypothetical protein
MAKLERADGTNDLKLHAATQATSANHVGLLAPSVETIGGERTHSRRQRITLRFNYCWATISSNIPFALGKSGVASTTCALLRR